jgi:hypothetical protein
MIMFSPVFAAIHISWGLVLGFTLVDPFLGVVLLIAKLCSLV